MVGFNLQVPYIRQSIRRYLHSIMVGFNRCFEASEVRLGTYLHSIMVGFNLVQFGCGSSDNNDLHSIMVGFNLQQFPGQRAPGSVFTFHYGRIQSRQVVSSRDFERIYIPLWSDSIRD